MGAPRTARPIHIPGDLTDPHGLAAHMLAHLEWMRVRHYAEATLYDRRFALEQFVGWCADRSIFRSADVTRTVLERFRAWLFYYRKADGTSLGIETQYLRLCALRGLFKWLTQEKQLLYNPAADIELPRRDKSLPRHVLTATETEEVLNQVDLTHPMGLRDRAMLETFYATGLRASELAHLSLYDLHREALTVLVRRGKGRKDRMVPLGERALLWVQAYLDQLRPKLVQEPAQDTLFLGRTGNPMRPGHLSNIARRHIRAALDRPGACHLFRHTAATLMLEGGADIRHIQAILGHAQLSTTQIYTHVSIEALKDVHQRTHPGLAGWKSPTDDEKKP